MAPSSRRKSQQGQAATEYILLGGTVVLPLLFMLVFTAQILWVWHSGVEWTRDGARYAATHCFQGAGDNVRTYMRTHVPSNLEQANLAGGSTDIQINYFLRNATSGTLDDFTCDGSECSTECIPDAVTISINGYEYRTFLTYLGLPPIAMPKFMTSMPIESAGCDPEQAVCLP